MKAGSAPQSARVPRTAPISPTDALHGFAPGLRAKQRFGRGRLSPRCSSLLRPDPPRSASTAEGTQPGRDFPSPTQTGFGAAERCRGSARRCRRCRGSGCWDAPGSRLPGQPAGSFNLSKGASGMDKESGLICWRLRTAARSVCFITNYAQFGLGAFPRGWPRCQAPAVHARLPPRGPAPRIQPGGGTGGRHPPR